MMSSERVGFVTHENVCPLSPELQLMSTADMFDTSWECSSNGDSGDLFPNSGSSMLSQTLVDYQDDLDASDTNQALHFDFPELNLKTFLGDFPLEFNLLEDTSSLMSDVSSSSSTITSYSIPESSGDFSVLRDIDTLEDDVDNDSSPSKSITDFPLQGSIIDPPANGAQNTDIVESLQSKVNHKENKSKSEEPNEYRWLVKKQKVSRRSPLKSASSLSNNISKSHDLELVQKKHLHQSPWSPSSKTRISAKENKRTVKTRKLHDILDSNIKWSDMSGSEQWVVGEGLSHMITQTLGIREKMDIVKLLGYSTTSEFEIAISGDHNLVSTLNDNSMEFVRHYLRRLDRDNLSSFKKFQKGKHGKHNFVSGTMGFVKEEKYTSGFEDATALSPAKLSKGNTQDKSCFQKRKESLPWTKHKMQKAKLDTITTASNKINRRRKSYKQGLKEERSGLFKQEVVVHLTNSSSSITNSKQIFSDDEDDGDVDIIG